MLVFVYGTLKKGHRNHHLLEDTTFIGNAVTRHKYDMLDSGFPVLIDSDCDGGHPVSGEVYEINTLTLKELDRLEGKGRMYDRVRKYVTMEDGTVARVSYYVGMPDYWKVGTRRRYEPVGDRHIWPEGRSA